MSFVVGAGFANCDILYSGVPRLPGEGEEIFSEGLQLLLGGGMPASMVNLSRLGVESHIITFLGQDYFSQFVEGQLRRYGVSYDNLYTGQDMPVVVSSVMITKSDRTIVSFQDPVIYSDTLQDELYQRMRGAKIVEMCLPVMDTYRRLKEDGCKLVFDVGWEDDLSVEKYRTCLELADYFTPNQKEAMKMTGTTDVWDAAECLSEYFEEVIIKLDKDGCLYLGKGQKLIVMPMMGVEAIDSTGAGDAFLSGFMYGLYHDRPIPECIACGNVTGGTCVQKVGCLTAFVTEEVLLKRAGEVSIRLAERGYHENNY